MVMIKNMKKNALNKDKNYLKTYKKDRVYVDDHP